MNPGGVGNRGAGLQADVDCLLAIVSLAASWFHVCLYVSWVRPIVCVRACSWAWEEQGAGNVPAAPLPQQ